MKERRRRGGDVSRQAYHPRSPPINSGGQTISLIEFNPGSPQEARRLVAPLGMERVGGGGGVVAEGRARVSMGWGWVVGISTRGREQTQGCRRQQ